MTSSPDLEIPDSRRGGYSSASKIYVMENNSNKAISKRSRQMAKQVSLSERRVEKHDRSNRKLGNRPKAIQRPSKISDILSLPATEYAETLANPFDGPLGSIPDYPPLPSRRMRVWSKGFFSTGTLQFGFCTFDPYATAAKDLGCVYSSDATFGGTASASTGAGVQLSTSNSDYSSTDFPTGGGNTTANSLLGTARVVGAGLRIRYSSTELNRGGVVAGATVANHTTLNGFNFAQMNAFECARRFRPQQKWMTTLFCPAKESELQYTFNLGSYGGAFNPAAGYTPNPIMGFFIQAPAAGTPVSFEYEAFAVLEVQGPAIRGLIPSLSDPAGHAAVTTTAQALMMPHDRDSSAHAKKFVQAAGTVAAHTLTGIAAHPKATENLSWMATTAGSVLTGLLALL